MTLAELNQCTREELFALANKHSVILDRRAKVSKLRAVLAGALGLTSIPEPQPDGGWRDVVCIVPNVHTTAGKMLKGQTAQLNASEADYLIERGQVANA